MASTNFKGDYTDNDIEGVGTRFVKSSSTVSSFSSSSNCSSGPSFLRDTLNRHTTGKKAVEEYERAILAPYSSEIVNLVLSPVGQLDDVDSVGQVVHPPQTALPSPLLENHPCIDRFDSEEARVKGGCGCVGHSKTYKVLRAGTILFAILLAYSLGTWRVFG